MIPLCARNINAMFSIKGFLLQLKILVSIVGKIRGFSILLAHWPTGQKSDAFNFPWWQGKHKFDAAGRSDSIFLAVRGKKGVSHLFSSVTKHRSSSKSDFLLKLVTKQDVNLLDSYSILSMDNWVLIKIRKNFKNVPNWSCNIKIQY